MFTKLSELNACHEKFWRTQKRHTDYLLRRRYIHRFVHRQFVALPICGVDLLPSDAYQRLRHEPSFESRIIEHARGLKAEGVFADKTRFGREPRRKAAHGSLSQHEIIRQFASRRANASIRTKLLWKPFFTELQHLGLNPRHSTSVIDAYEYDGKNGVLAVNYRQFEKLVSHLAPRRENRKPAA